MNSVDNMDWIAGIMEYVAQGKIVIIALPNGTNMIVSPEVLERYHKIFKSDVEIMPDIPQ